MTTIREPRKLILVGRVAGAFGIKGEVRISAYTETPDALLRYRDLKREDGTPALTLLSGRPQKAELIARAAEVATKEGADALRGLNLYIPREALAPPEDEDDFYLADLIGLEAITPGGAPLGTVKAVPNHGAGDILEVDPGDGRPTLLFSFTREVAPEVRIAEGRIVIVPPAEVEAEREPTTFPGSSLPPA